MVLYYFGLQSKIQPTNTRMSASFGFGQLEPADTASEFNVTWFIIQQALGQVRTNIPVKIISVTPFNGTALSGVVQVQPLINQVDGQGNSVPHGNLFQIPYLRIQGGLNAIIIDPSVGDVGLMVCCDRDISSFQSNGGTQSNPGSERSFDFSDGVYLFSFPAQQPTQTIEFTLTGINITSLGIVSITAPGGLLVNGTPVTIP